MTLRYFAFVREQLGIASEHIDFAAVDGDDITALLRYLSGRGGVYTRVFDGTQIICVACNRLLVRADHRIVDGDEVAFFPPVTGG